MRTTLKWARAGMAAVLFVATCVGDVAAADMSAQTCEVRWAAIRCCAFRVTRRFRCRSASISASAGRSSCSFPSRSRTLSSPIPSMLDAVVQSSDRVFLIAKKTGQTNAFFFDEFGQQILTLEVAVGADLSALDQLLTRLIPGSNVHSEIAGTRHRADGHGAHAHRFQPRGADRRPVRARPSEAGSITRVPQRRARRPRRARRRTMTAWAEGTPTTSRNNDNGGSSSSARRRRRLRGKARHQPSHRRGRGAGDAPRQSSPRCSAAS